MGVPYNFLQELSGVGRTIAPYEFRDSTRYIGTTGISNYLIPEEDSHGFNSSLNLGQKRNGSNVNVFNYSSLESLSNTATPVETGYVRLSFPKSNLGKGPLETGNISLLFLGKNSFSPLETGSVSISLLQNFTSGIAEYSNLDLFFNYNFQEVVMQEADQKVTMGIFIENINKIYSSLELEVITGEYYASLTMLNEDSSNLSLTIIGGTYQGF